VGARCRQAATQVDFKNVRRNNRALKAVQGRNVLKKGGARANGKEEPYESEMGKQYIRGPPPEKDAMVNVPLRLRREKRMLICLRRKKKKD